MSSKMTGVDRWDARLYTLTACLWIVIVIGLTA